MAYMDPSGGLSSEGPARSFYALGVVLLQLLTEQVSRVGCVCLCLLLPCTVVLPSEGPARSFFTLHWAWGVLLHLLTEQ
jgi:hypothetical protein